ncbi:MAG: AAA family ATPase [Archaeoglobaceae archaeon]
MNECVSVKNFEIALSRHFVGREEEARVVTLALATKQHAVLIGPPGTAKSATIMQASKMLNVPYFYILLNKFTTTDELLGYIDPVKFKNGVFERNKNNKLPTAKVAFIDEIFKGSSEVLNAILNIMNERLFVDIDGNVHRVPLHSLFAASNETPAEDLAALYDRFLMRHFVKPLDSTRVQEAIEYMIAKNGHSESYEFSIFERCYEAATEFMAKNAPAIAKAVAQIVMVLRQHGIFVSDRTAISKNHYPRLVATYAMLYNCDFKKAVLATSKYLLGYTEDLENYKKALDSLIPPEIREANDKLERAFELAGSGDLKSAKREAAEAIQILQSLLTKKNVDIEEVRELLAKAEKLNEKIASIEKSLEELKRR